MVNVSTILKKKLPLIYVAKHRYDAVCTHTENTDTDAYYRGCDELGGGISNLHNLNTEIYLHKYNIPATCFHTYYANRRWNKENFGIVHNFGLISFNNAYYLGQTLGFSQTIVDNYRSYISAFTGKNPSTLSYQGGIDSGKSTLLPFFLGGRNSVNNYPSDSETSYGIGCGNPSVELTHSDSISRKNSARWWDFWNNLGHTKAEADTYVQTNITKSIQQNGWFNNFIHWHYMNVGDADYYFNLINNTYNGVFVHKCGYDEAVEYEWHRKNINSVNLIKNGNQFDISIFRANLENIDTSLISTPISIVINLAGTFLQNKTIATSNCLAIRQISANKYSFDVAYNINSFSIYEGDDALLDFTVPQITSQSYSSGVLSFTVNKPINAVLYLVSANGEFYNCDILYRENGMKNSYSIDFNSSTIRNYYTTRTLASIEASDIYIGLITKEKQASLSNKIRLI